VIPYMKAMNMKPGQENIIRMAAMCCLIVGGAALKNFFRVDSLRAR
jgi:hypothetical protein